MEAPEAAAVQPYAIRQPRSLGPQTRSEQDWRWVMVQLNAGIPAQEIVQTLAYIRRDKPDPLYYAHRTVDVANAVRGIRNGVDLESVIERLKEHDSALSAVRTAEIARTLSGLFSVPEFCTQRRINMPLFEITQSRQISASVSA